MTEIEMSGFATAHMNARTVEDLRTLVGWLNKYNVPNSADVEFDRGMVYVELTGRDSVPVEWIECGDHMPPALRFDLIIPTHGHDDENAPSGPAEFDWPAKDRLKEAYKQAPNNYEEALERGYDRYSDERRPE